MHVLKLTFCLGVAAVAGNVILPAVECSEVSPARHVAPVDVYTPQGCDRCPPADAWLREPANAMEARGHAVHSARHLDFRDSVAWKDRYAALDVVESRSWRADADSRTQLDEIDRTKSQGSLSIVLAPYPASINIEGMLTLLGDRRGADFDACFPKARA